MDTGIIDESKRAHPSGAAASIRRLLVARGLRAFGDGFVSLLLPLLPARARLRRRSSIGVIATATLLGSGLLTLAVGLAAHRYPLPHAAARRGGPDGGDRSRRSRPSRNSGRCSSSPSSARSIRRAATSACSCRSSTRCSRGVVDDRQRTAVFARYSLVGALAAAVGSLAAPDFPRCSRRVTGLAAAGVAPVDVRCSTRSLGARSRRSPIAGCRARSNRVGAARTHGAARPIEAQGLPARRALQPRRVRRRLRRAVDGRAVAVPALRSLERDGRHDLLLDRHALARCRISSPCASRTASAWSTRWCSRTCRPTSAWC